MDTLTFISKLIDALAWPAVAIALALVFRKKINELLARIRKGKIPGAEFEFSEDALRVLSDAPPRALIPSSSSPSTSSSSGSSQRAYSVLDPAYAILEHSPRAAVQEGWQELQKAALQRLEFYDDDDSSADYPTRTPRPIALTSYLRDQQILDVEEVVIFNELRNLRNRAVHAPEFEITIEKARDYLILCELLIESLGRSQP